MKKWIKRWLGNLLREEIDNKIRCATALLERKVRDLERQLDNAVDIGVDLHQVHPEDTTIWVMSRLKTGRIEHVNVVCHDMKDVIKLVKDLKERYGNARTYVDAVPPHAHMIRDMTDWR